MSIIGFFEACLRYAQDKFDYLVKNPKAYTASLNREVKDVTDKLFRAWKDKDIKYEDYERLIKEFNKINSENVKTTRAENARNEAKTRSKKCENGTMNYWR